VRHGYYKEGKFKFDLHLNHFPQQQPKIYFLSQVFHPLIDYQSGELDVSTMLGQVWNYGSEVMLYTLINGLYRVFNGNKYLSVKESFNRKSAELF
jgi:ubiquitin-protein ligase